MWVRSLWPSYVQKCIATDFIVIKYLWIYLNDGVGWMWVCVCVCHRWSKRCCEHECMPSGNIIDILLNGEKNNDEKKKRMQKKKCGNFYVFAFERKWNKNNNRHRGIVRTCEIATEIKSNVGQSCKQSQSFEFVDENRRRFAVKLKYKPSDRSTERLQ